jgi:tetratricopeptide (TPR) repeat protein
LQLGLDNINGIELVQLGSFWDIDEFYDSGDQLEDEVDYVLQGQVRAENNLIEVSAELRKPGRERPIWKEQYTTSDDNFLGVQNRIVLSVSSELKLASNSEEVATRVLTADRAAYRDYLIGQDLMRRGEASHLRQAIERFQWAQEKDEGFTQALASECRSNLELFKLTNNVDDFNRGKENCTRLSSLEDQGAQANLAMAELYVASGELEAAKSHFLKVLDVDAGNPDANMGLADILVREDDMQRAHSFYQAAVNANPTYWKAQNALGSFYFRSGMYHQAVESYTRATELMDDNAAAFSNLGAARLYVGDFDGASDAWLASTKLDPNFASYSNTGAALFYANRYPEAIQNYRAALALNPEDHRLWGNLAEALLMDGADPQETRTTYESAISLAEAVTAINPDDAPTLSRLAVYYAAIDRKEIAVQNMNRARDIAGLDLDVLYDSAVALTLMDQLTDAKEVVAKALEAGYPRTLIQADPLLRHR